MQFIDIGANLTDGMFQGIYHDKKYHDPDLAHVINRAVQAGVHKIIITSGSVSDVRAASELIPNHSDILSTTVGVHPTRCNEFGNSEEEEHNYFSQLKDLLISGSNSFVSCLGEFGLDYDRLDFCSKEVQKRYFEKQLIQLCPLSASLSYNKQSGSHLPLFLHNRNSTDDLVQILHQNRQHFQMGRGVVHSFDGSADELYKILELGWFIGINGCSLKTQDNLDVLKLVPSDRLLIETDAPWCEIRPSHAGSKYIKTNWNFVRKEKYKPTHSSDVLVKSRCEPCQIRQVLEVIAGHRNEDLEKLGDHIYQNTINLFFPKGAQSLNIC